MHGMTHFSITPLTSCTAYILHFNCGNASPGCIDPVSCPPDSLLLMHGNHACVQAAAQAYPGSSSSGSAVKLTLSSTYRKSSRRWPSSYCRRSHVAAAAQRGRRSSSSQPPSWNAHAPTGVPFGVGTGRDSGLPRKRTACGKPSCMIGMHAPRQLPDAWRWMHTARACGKMRCIPQ